MWLHGAAISREKAERRTRVLLGYAMPTWRKRWSKFGGPPALTMSQFMQLQRECEAIQVRER